MYRFKNMTLLEETLLKLGEAGMSPDDIDFLRSKKRDAMLSWDQFKLLADREYDSGYGTQEVIDDLIIVFKDKTYLERKEYDGAECWDHVVFYEKPTPQATIIKSIFNEGWK